MRSLKTDGPTNRLPVRQTVIQVVYFSFKSGGMVMILKKITYPLYPNSFHFTSSPSVCTDKGKQGIVHLDFVYHMTVFKGYIVARNKYSGCTLFA